MLDSVEPDPLDTYLPYKDAPVFHVVDDFGMIVI